MRFVYPLGLLGLIGVPVLIIIYIIKNKYTEQTVTSTYLWTLSERFLKRKNPLDKLTGILSLVLQILAVVFVSLSIAHPYFVLRGVAHEYCFILDASGSMTTIKDGVTSFDLGKQKIRSYIETAADGSSYTIVCMGDTANVICEQLDNKKRALELLDSVTPTHTQENTDEAFKVAQRRFDENTSLKTYFITDKNYQIVDNVTLINVSVEQINYSISKFTYLSETQDKGSFTGEIYAENAGADFDLLLYINGSETPYAKQNVTIDADCKYTFTIDYEGEVLTATAVLDTADAQSLDNTAVYYSKENQQTYDALIVSEQPFFLQQALQAVGHARIDVVSPKDYVEGEYDLYIFDAYTPAKMPRYGVVWLLALDNDLEKSGFSIYGAVDLLDGGKIEISSSSNSAVRKLTAGLVGSDVYINRYRKYGGLRAGCDFKIIYEYKSTPMIFMGNNEYGNKQVVFAFDLHDSNFPLTVDYSILMYNLLNASFPLVLEKTSYNCGETLEINLPADCRHVEIKTPSGKVEMKSPQTVNGYTMSQAGVYALTVKTSTSEDVYYVYAGLAQEESSQKQTADYAGVHGTPTQEGIDGKWDKLLIFFIVLGILFAADWVVYCYDKYQLR